MPLKLAPSRVQWTVDLLDVRPTDHILEIGCGPGHAVHLVCERLGRGTVTGIDRSAVAVTRARERNRAHIAAGRARIEQATLEDAELDRRFRKVFAINVNAFWTTPATSLAALARCMEPTATAWLVYEPPGEKGLNDLRVSLPEHLEANGFNVIRIETTRFRPGFGLAIVARRR